MNKITIIDSPTGSGKTNWAIQEMKNNPTQSYIYVTPFLNEISRINDPVHGCNYRFKEPTHEYGQKIEDFNRLLANCSDVAVTHSTFLNATEETMRLLQEGDYICVIDEALDIVRNFNDISETSQDTRQKIYDTDIVDTMEKYGMIHIREDNKVEWIGDHISNPENKYYVVCKYATLGRLYCVDKKFLLTVFPPEIFGYFKKIYVMTYLIESSLFYYYMKLYDIEYELKCIVRDEQDGRCHLVDYDIKYDLDHRRKSKDLINICDNERMNNFRYSAFSASWYKDKGARHKDILMLKNNMSNYFRRIIQCKSADVMWTTYKTAMDKLAVSGYKLAKPLPKDKPAERKRSGKMKKNTKTCEQKMNDAKKQESLNKYSCFVACNAKATNDFMDRSVLAYMINININPEIGKFFLPYTIDKNAFSIGMLLQWIWRSRIRNNPPEKIDLYLPSPRMRKLLNDWFDGSDIPTWKIEYNHNTKTDEKSDVEVSATLL